MIPKIIHQLWEGPPLSDFFNKLVETWKKYHPDWKYEFWNGDRMKDFVVSNYPQMADVLFKYKYNIQRWDLIRYLILHKLGGMYIDIDYECLESFDKHIINNDNCYFGMEPENHRIIFGKKIYFSNSLMVTPPGHSFFEYVISHLQTASVRYTENQLFDVLSSTGPLMLTNLYEEFDNKTIIDFFSAELVMPWSKNEVQMYIKGTANNDILEKKLRNAISIHYFWGSWLNNEKQ